MLLSIIIPVYNNEKNLTKLLNNLKPQTIFELYKDEIEIIVVDDGSKEIEKLRNLEIKGLKLQKYFIDHSGAAKARNFGWQKSTGEYIFFCDSDVIFLKNNALEKMLNVLENNLDKAYSYSSFKFGWKTFKLFPFDQEKLKQNNYISTMSLIRRRALEKLSFPNIPWDESLKKFQDWDLWLALLAHHETGIFLPELLWQSKSHGTMSSWLPKFFYRLTWLKKVKEYELAKKIIKQKHHL
ncbi:MAG TPA: glycosyltransferase family 2 protein [bacterium]|nr:glycosyltransferase family 2 protein [bacterium]HPL95532.1 glycosyltransferase family 2 protein [bacterium]